MSKTVRRTRKNRAKSGERPPTTVGPQLLRQTSRPTTKGEMDMFDYCFEGGEEIIFYMCTEPMSIIAPHGMHMGIKVIRNGKTPSEFTLGFYPIERSTTAVLTSFVKGVPGAIFAPDPQLNDALKKDRDSLFDLQTRGIERKQIHAKEIYRTTLSEESAIELNHYTCGGHKTRVIWSENQNELGFGQSVTMFIPENLRYKFIYGTCTEMNCRGFISTIFKNDEDVIKKISATLWGLENRLIRDNKKRLERERRQRARQVRQAGQPGQAGQAIGVRSSLSKLFTQALKGFGNRRKIKHKKAHKETKKSKQKKGKKANKKKRIKKEKKSKKRETKKRKQKKGNK
jgi:hypothetical protein